MKKNMILSIVLLLCALVYGETRYTFSYILGGEAASTFLLFIPFRAFYEASAGVTCRVQPDATGKVDSFYPESLGQTSYILRTLGFSGKSLAMLVLDYNLGKAAEFGAAKVAKWRQEVPAYAAKINSSETHLFITGKPDTQSLAFTREQNGLMTPQHFMFPFSYQDPQKSIAIYFRPFAVAENIMQFFKYAVLPEKGNANLEQLPATWFSPPLDFTQAINALGKNVEAIVEKYITVEQKAKFRQIFKVSAETAETIEITGEAHPQVTLWKGFFIRDFIRKVVWRKSDRLLISDQISMEIRNEKGQGVYGKALLELNK